MKYVVMGYKTLRDPGIFLSTNVTSRVVIKYVISKDPSENIIH